MKGISNDRVGEGYKMMQQLLLCWDVVDAPRFQCVATCHNTFEQM
jgi:hypothetical protein